MILDEAMRSWELEGAPQWHRMFMLNGGYDREAEPHERPATDREDDDFAVDGLTLRMRHSVTDLRNYPLHTDFPIAIRRVGFAAAWQDGVGLVPRLRPDLPFGHCWRSGLASHLHVIDAGSSSPLRVEVTDEQGVLHWFIALYRQGEIAGYYPLPGGDHTQDSRAMSLVRHDDHFLFRRKYGMKLFFEGTPTIDLTAAGTGGASERHTFHRLRQVIEPRGDRLDPHFESGNTSLVPDRLAGLGGRGFAIARDARGLVTTITTDRGFETRYHYRDATLPGGAPLLIEVESLGAGVVVSRDEYAEETFPGGVHTTGLSLSTDARDFSFRYVYAAPFPGADYPPIAEVQLPNRGTSTYRRYVTEPDANGVWQQFTFARNAAGHGFMMHFADRARVSLDHLPWRREAGSEGATPTGPRILTYRSLELSAYRNAGHRFESRKGRIVPGLWTKLLLRERFELDLGAGLFPHRAVNAEGKIFEFEHASSFTPAGLDVFSPGEVTNPLAERWGDVTKTIDPEGRQRHFIYHPTYRRLIRREDELGRATVWELDEATGMKLSESVYAAPVSGSAPLFARTEYAYEDPRYPGFVTRKIIRKVPRETAAPEWESDLVTSYAADAFGDKIRETDDPDGLQRSRIYRFDPEGFLHSILYPNGLMIQYLYDASGRVLRLYRPGRRVKIQQYDPRGNLVRSVGPADEETVWEYDEMSMQTYKRSTTDMNGKPKVDTWRYRLNAMSRNLHVEEPGKPPEDHTLDALGRVVKVRKGRLGVVAFTYGPHGSSLLFSSVTQRQIGTREGFRYWRFTYDSHHRRLGTFRGSYSFFDPPVNRNVHDAAGNLIEEWQGGACTRRAYDALNRQVLQTEPNGAWKRTLYTSTGLEYGWESSNGQRQVKRFDAAGAEVD